MSSVKEGYQDKIPNTSVITTNSTPIHKLASDNLILIFFALKKFSDSTYNRQPRCDAHKHLEDAESKWDWTLLTHVCQYWRTTALETPTLWTDLTPFFFNDPQRTDAFLERSRGAELVVCTSVPGPANIADDLEEPSSACLLKVARQIHRIRKLHFFLDDKMATSAVWKQVLVILTRPAPCLQSFGMSFSEFSEWPEGRMALTGLPESAPVMKELRISQFSMSNGFSLKSITNLVEVNLCGIEGLTPIGFLSWLQSCPDLQALHVEGIVWDTACCSSRADIMATFLSFRNVFVNLPKLSFISVSFDKQVLLNNIVYKHLIIPPSASWKCAFTYDVKEVFFFVDFYKQFAWPDQSLSESSSLVCEQVDIWSLPCGFIVTQLNLLRGMDVKGGIPPIPRDGLCMLSDSLRAKFGTAACLSSLELQWRMASSPTWTFEDAAEIVGSEHWKTASSVRLDMCRDYRMPRVEDSSWAFVLGKFPAVTTLIMKGSIYFPENVNLCSFMNAFAYHNENDKVFCPKLEHLTLWVPLEIQQPELPGTFMTALIDALKYRKSLGHGVKSLIIPGGDTFLDSASVLALEELVGQFSRDYIGFPPRAKRNPTRE